jgi:hypothetical protein
MGWVLLSREALSRAETQLREDVTGVRDEVGFLLIHAGYANRFFPGTSVLHTRLRYLLFIPWMYRDLLSDGERDMGQKVSNAETRLAGRLRDLEGTIGKRSYPDPTSQPPTFVYWTALGTWGLLKRYPDGIWPTKTQLHLAMAKRRTPNFLSDDDGSPLEDVPDFFIRVPPPPAEWCDANASLSFTLPRGERAFMQKQLIGVMKPGDHAAPSLLSQLAEHVSELEPQRAQNPWSRVVMQHADADDKAALQRASMAAAMSDVGRAVYAAIVETVREREDGIATEDRHRRHLVTVLARSAEKARSLSLSELNADLPDMPPYLRDVLNQTLSWLANPGDPMQLRDVYAQAEDARKGRRARLVKKLSGKERRFEWRPEDQTLASAIQYRWPNVLRMLRDLKGET